MLNGSKDSGIVVGFTGKPAPASTTAELHAVAKRAAIEDAERLRAMTPDQQVAQLVELVPRIMELVADQQLQISQVRDGFESADYREDSRKYLDCRRMIALLHE